MGTLQPRDEARLGTVQARFLSCCLSADVCVWFVSVLSRGIPSILMVLREFVA